MTQPKLITKPFADDALPGYVNEIPKENPVGAPEQNASWAVGFPPITMTDIDDGGLPPNGEDMNGVLRAITQHNLFIGGGGVYEFTDEYITEVGGYSKGAVLISDDKTALWMSIQDNNTQNFNGATKTQWRRIAFTELDSTLASIQDALNTKADKSVTITAGDGLTGGGTLAGNRVIAVNSSVVRTDRTITAGTGLSGGGNLSANRTLSVNYGTTAGTAAQGNDSRITGAAQKSANLSDLSSDAAARQNLGLGTAATRDVGESSGNVMEVGAFGVGSTLYSVSDVTNTTPTGIYSFNAGSTGLPPQVDPNGAVGLIFNWGSQHQWGLFGKVQNNRVFLRRYLNTQSNNDVVELHTTGNILTTTGQSTYFPMTQKSVTDALNTKADTSTQVIAGTGLIGGGNLSANRTLSVNYGTTAGTAAQGNDTRITGAAQKSANLSDLASAPAARQNLGLGTAATRDVGVSSGNVMEVGAGGVLTGQITNWDNFATVVYNQGVRTEMGSGDNLNNPYGIYNATGRAHHFAFGNPNYLAGLFCDGDDGTENIKLVFYAYGAGNRRRFAVLSHSGNLKQSTGQETMYSMSQKAVTDALNTKVDLTGNQTISGLKTFSQFPVTPSAAPTANYQTANKKYVDDSAIGVGQTWQDVSGRRSWGTTYTNTNGRPIQVFISANGARLTVNGANLITGSLDGEISVVVPNGATYSATGTTPLVAGRWMELR